MKKSTLQTIASKIRSKGTIQQYAKEIGITSANLYNFLNGKLNIGVDSLEKILTPIGMCISGTPPSHLEEVETVLINGKAVKKNGIYKKKKVILCFQSGSTSHCGILLKGKKGVEAIIFDE